MKCELSRVVYTNYVRYDNLNNLVIPAYMNAQEPINTVAVYIDLYSIFKSLYNENIIIEDYIALTSCIINMVAHYRDYFRRINTNSVFFIINSQNHAFYNTQLVAGYNDKTYHMFCSNAKITDMIDNNHELLNLVCKYIDGVYYIKRTTESSVIMYDLMCKYDPFNKYAHMVISKDIIPWQLCAYKPNTTILRPKKKNGNDISFIVTRDSLLPYYMSRKKNNAIYNGISPELFTIIMGGSSCTDRNMKSLCNITKVIESLTKLITNNEIINAYAVDPMYVYTKMANNGLRISPYIASTYFKALDVIHQQLIFMNTLESDYSIELVNLRNKQGIQEINNTYFRNYPLDLNRL